MNSDVTASDIDQYKMLSTLCHFISKQWIGYYVTMTNWSDDWLRIGINYFLQTECANQVGVTLNEIFHWRKYMYTSKAHFMYLN